jgi:serine/threonine-protein kinase
MSPEQITGAPLGPAADLYALGVTLFQALTGRLPFPGPDIVAQHLGEAPPRPSLFRENLTPAHDAVLLRALAKAPGDRWETARQMADAIVAWPTGDALTAPITPVASGEPDFAPGAPASTAEALAMGRSAAGGLFRQDDPRLGRPVLVELREQPVEGAALEQLRAVAALGGPFVQRVLALSDDGRSVTYEFLSGPRQRLDALPADLAAALAETHRALIAAGQLTPHAAAEVILTSAGPVLPVVLSDEAATRL